MFIFFFWLYVAILGSLEIFARAQAHLAMYRGSNFHALLLAERPIQFKTTGVPSLSIRIILNMGGVHD